MGETLHNLFSVSENKQNLDTVEAHIQFKQYVDKHKTREIHVDHNSGLHNSGHDLNKGLNEKELTKCIKLRSSKRKRQSILT